MPGADPFGTAAIRAASLAAWLSSPTRLREDANVEEDHARGYYRDRAIVELAQNAADAAVAARQPGRLLLRLETRPGGALLTAANTGASLTPAGVLALASMRASAKRPHSTAPDTADGGSVVGQFGVGFSAVRALSDEIGIASAGGAVVFSASRARALLTHAIADRAAGTSDQSVLSALRQVLERPSADLPILRLPFDLDTNPTPAEPRIPQPHPRDLTPADLTVPPGYDTAVVAHLRGPHERATVRTLLESLDDALLLALPALGEVRIEIEGAEPRALAGAAERWRTVHATGHHRAVDLAGRPHEERTRTGWSVTWALPRAGTPADLRQHLHEPHVLHAPTPTEEPCTLPALLVATFPLDPSRRHVAPGPATDALAAEAGNAYAELAEQVARAGGDPLALVPTGLAAGRLDGLLRAAALAALTTRPLLAPVSPWADLADPDPAPSSLRTPREAQAIAGSVGHDPAALAAFAPSTPGLVAVPRGLENQARLRALGVEIRDLGDVVDGLPTAQSPQRWRAIYAALAPHLTEPGVADALGSLPVPLVDGRTVRGPRGLVAPSAALADAGEAVDVLAPWGLRVIDPAAVHPMLTRLGAVELDAHGLLAHAAVRAAVAAAADGDLDPDQEDDVVAAVLALVAEVLRAGADPDDVAAAHPWLAALPLPDADGETVPARGLTVPGSWADRILDALRPVDPDLVEPHGSDVLRAVGVRDRLQVVRIADVVAEDGLEVDDDAPEAALDGWSDYLAELVEALGPGAYVGEVAAIADLDAVAEASWREVLSDIAADGSARAALLTPVRSGGRAGPSYASWWLRDYFGAPFAAPGTQVPFLDPAPAELSEADDGARPSAAGADTAQHLAASDMVASDPAASDPAALDPAVLAAIGAVADLGTLDAAGWERYLDGLPDVGTPVPVDAAAAIWRGLAALIATTSGSRVRLHADRLPVLRTATGSDRQPQAVIADADDVVVAAEPMWAQIADVVPAPAELADSVADALDLEVAGEREPGLELEGAVECPTPVGLLSLLPNAPAAYTECHALRVGGVEVAWWVVRSRVYAATAAGLARGLSQASGSWTARSNVEAALADPHRLATLVVERAWDPCWLAQRAPQSFRSS